MGHIAHFTIGIRWWCNGVFVGRGPSLVGSQDEGRTVVVHTCSCTYTVKQAMIWLALIKLIIMEYQLRVGKADDIHNHKR